MVPAEIVREFYSRYRNRDLDGAMALCSEDVAFVWTASSDHSQFAGVVSGKARFHERLLELDSVFDYLGADLSDIIADGDRVAVQVRFKMRRKATGQEFVMPCADFWTVSDGKLSRFIEYYDTALGESILAK